MSFAAVSAVVVFVSFSVVTSRAYEEVHRSDDFWARVIYRGAEVDAHATGAEMLADSDAVVVGRFIAMEPGRVMGDAGEDNAAFYLAGTLEIAEVIYQNANRIGELAPGDHIVVETFTFEPGEVETLARSFPTERALLFLRNKGVSAERVGSASSVIAAESAYFRLMAAGGIIRDLPSGPAAVVPDDDRLAGLAQETFDGTVAAAYALAAAQTSRFD